MNWYRPEVLGFFIFLAVHVALTWRARQIFNREGELIATIIDQEMVRKGLMWSIIAAIPIFAYCCYLQFSTATELQSGLVRDRNSYERLYNWLFCFFIYFCLCRQPLSSQTHVFERGVMTVFHRKSPLPRFYRWKDIASYRWSFIEPDELVLTTRASKTVIIRVGESQRPVVEPLLSRYVKTSHPD